MKSCKEENCKEKYYAKEYCRKHYRIFNGEYHKRWIKVKNDPKLYETFSKSRKNYINKVKDKDWFKDAHNKRQKSYYYRDNKRKEYLKEWKKNQPIEKKRLWQKRDDNVFHFGGLREEVIKRDNYKCVVCGMAREEHKKEFGIDLIVNHVDHKGRMVPRQQKNNDINNLQTLCCRHHVMVDRGTIKI
jgi:predicted restriction endonuclease